MISVNFDPSYWFDSQLFTIDPLLIKSMEVVRSPDETFRLNRTSAESEWNITPLAKGKRLKTNGMEALSRCLNTFPFESVIPVDSITAPIYSYKFTAELFDGRRITIQLGQQSVEKKTRLIAVLKMELLDVPEARSQTKTVEAFNQKVQPWIFILETWAAEAFLPTYEGLLKSNTY